MKKIEYENKQAIQNDDSIAKKNKVTDEDMNEIKEVVNENADELKELQEDNGKNKTTLEALQSDISSIKQKNTEQDKSIQSNTEKIEANAENIEANQNNIKALQVENAEVKAENERLKSDIESISLVGEVEGESVDLDDSSGARFRKFGIGGNHSQVTREGYNFFNIEDYTNIALSSNNNPSNLTKEENAISFVTGTGRYCGFYITKENISKYIDNFDENTSYYISCDIVASAATTLSIGSKTTQDFFVNTSKKRIQVQSLIDGLTFYNMTTTAGITIIITNIQISVKEAEYEQYGATPSLKFPSEVKAVKDSANEVICNKNKLKLTEVPKILGVSVSKNNGKLVLNGTATSTNDNIKIGTFYAKKDKTYIMSIKNKISGFGVNLNNNRVGIAENLINITKSSTATVSKAAIATDNGKVDVYIAINKDTVFNNFEVKIQIEENTTATSTIEHQEQTITMPVQQKMLKEDYFDWENEKEVHKWNLLSFTGNEAWSLLSGATSVFLLGNVSGQTYGGHDFSICTHFKYDTRVGGMANLQDETFAMQYEYSALYVKCNKFTTVEEWKAYLKSQYENGTPIKLAYITANITELSFTDEQKAVAKQIKETLHTYKNITHIYSADETSPIMNVEYAKDLNTTISNIQALVLNNASEEVNG